MSAAESLFSGELKQKADAIVARYETKRASVLEVLRLVMEERGFVSLEAEAQEVAAYLGIAPIDVREVVTFYTLFYTKPKAKTRLNICQTLSCSLLGSDALVRHCAEKLGIKPGQATPDGKFSLQSVECLGACEIAPMMQVNDDQYVGQLTKEKIDEILRKTP